MHHTGVVLAGIGRRVSRAAMMRKGGMPRLKQQRSWAKERFKVLSCRCGAMESRTKPERTKMTQAAISIQAR